MIFEELSEAAWQTYLIAGGRLLGQPGTPMEFLSVDYIAAWRKVAQHIVCLMDRDAEVSATELAKNLSDVFYSRLAGEVVFRDFSKQPLAEQVAWEAVARNCQRLAIRSDSSFPEENEPANDGDDDNDDLRDIDWCGWARKQIQLRGKDGPLQNA